MAVNTKPSDEKMRAYMTELYEQDDRTICINCYKTGIRKDRCRGAALFRKDLNKGWTVENVACCCCWLGDEKEKAFDNRRWTIKCLIMTQLGCGEPNSLNKGWTVLNLKIDD